MTHPLRRSAVSAALLLVVLFGVFPLTRALGGGYADVTMLRDAVSSSFVDFWRAGDDTLNVGLAGAVDYWARFHVSQGGTGIGSARAAVSAWRADLAGLFHGGRFRPSAVTGHCGTCPCGVLCARAYRPSREHSRRDRSAVLSTRSDASWRWQQVARSGGNAVQSDLAGIGSHSPALETLQSDFARYHFVMAALSVLVVLAVTAWAVSLLRRRSRVPREARRQRRVLLLGAGGALILGGFFGLVAAANASTAIDPGPALAGFFAGGL